MDMGRVGPQPHVVALADAELADIARREAAASGSIDVEERVATDMRGGRHRPLPALLAVADRDVLGPDTDRRRAMSLRRLLADEVHARRSDETGHEQIRRPLIEIE